ncbi:MAG: phenylacetate--CoA ligase family protein [Candidatus Omnitrophica bacterium]|nr:phenylacetate--CoA ligase family protein [Candidatus Omnitrophota bacterium]
MPTLDLKTALHDVSALLKHFKKTDPRYADVRLPIVSREQFQQLPVVARDEMRRFNPVQGLSAAHNVTATSGSTAERLTIVHSKECYEAHLKRLVRIYQGIGMNKKDLCLNLCAYSLNSGGRLMEQAYKAAGCGVIPCGVFDTPEQLDEAVTLIKALKPTIVNAYTNQLFDLFSKLGKRHSIRRCVVNGEPLWPAYKKQIEHLGGVKVFDHYGAMEVSGFAIAVDAQDAYMKIFDDGLMLEVLAEDGRAGDTGIGALLVTDLNNTCMPFIRYKLGDQVDMIRRGRSRFIRVLGRLNDTILIDGEILSVSAMREAAHCVLGHPDFFFTIDKDPVTYKDRVVLYVADGRTPRLDVVLNAVGSTLGLSGRLSCQPWKNDMPKTSTGKRRQVIDRREGRA